MPTFPSCGGGTRVLLLLLLADAYLPPPGRLLLFLKQEGLEGGGTPCLLCLLANCSACDWKAQVTLHKDCVCQESLKVSEGSGFGL